MHDLEMAYPGDEEVTKSRRMENVSLLAKMVDHLIERSQAQRMLQNRKIREIGIRTDDTRNPCFVRIPSRKDEPYQVMYVIDTSAGEKVRTHEYRCWIWIVPQNGNPVSFQQYRFYDDTPPSGIMEMYRNAQYNDTVKVPTKYQNEPHFTSLHEDPEGTLLRVLSGILEFKQAEKECGVWKREA